jgi:two-component system, chemotaxis family, CheB/CheR fusion protein
VLETQQPLERRVSRRDRTAHYLCRINLYRSPAGAVEGTLVTFVEVTSLVRVESQQMMIDELNHRVKNMLAVVLSLAAQTADGATSLESFRVAFGGRLQALSTTYSLLGQGGWLSVDLREIMHEELRPFLADDGRNIAIRGPPLGLNANAALVLGMVVHELATNAVKYGALAAPGGRIDVRWEDAGGRFTLDWTESGGPAMAAPARQGFGLTLIDRSIAHELDGSASFDFAAAGLHMRIEAPLEHLAYRPEPASTQVEPVT